MPTQKRDQENEKKSLTGKTTKSELGSKKTEMTSKSVSSKGGSMGRFQEETQAKRTTSQDEETQDEPKRRKG